MTPIDLLRQHRASFPGSTAKYAAQVIGTIPRHVPSVRSIRRWLAGSVPIPPEVVAWLEAQSYKPVSGTAHEKSDSAD